MIPLLLYLTASVGNLRMDMRGRRGFLHFGIHFYFRMIRGFFLKRENALFVTAKRRLHPIFLFTGYTLSR